MYKFSSLCIISALLLGSGNVEAAYYFYRDQPEVVVVNPCNTCNSCNTCHKVHHRSPCAHKHHYRHVVHHYYRDNCGSPQRIQQSHYSISTYYVYSSPCGNVLWVPTCGSCNTGCGGVSVEEYNRAFYGPYYPANSGYSDFDMDTRTADDVYNEY